MFAGTIDKMFPWTPKRLTEESITALATSDNKFAQKLTFTIMQKK